MAWGLLLPALFALNVQAHAFLALSVSLVVTLGLAFMSGLRRGKWICLSVVIAIIGGAFLLFQGRSGMLSTMLNTVNAIYLKLTGQNAALPLYAAPCAGLLALVFSPVAYVICKKNAGFYSALTLGMLMLTVLWVTGRQDLLVYCLPMVAALVILYAGNVHEGLPTKKVLPLAMALVAVAFLLVPPGGIGSPALQKTAADIRQKIYDYLFFNESRNVFSLAAEGYYPNGITQLGGKAEPQNHPVMTVTTDEKVYLRGAAKDKYTGRTWENTTGGKRYLYVSPRFASLRDTVIDLKLPVGEYYKSAVMKESQVTVRMVSGSASTLFVPQRVRALDMLSSGMVPYFNSASEIFITRDLASGDTYRVSAPLIQAGDPGLATLIEAVGEMRVGGDAVDPRYTDLPEHMEQLVYELARSITEGAVSPYDKALAIQNYLSRYYKYTLDPKSMEGNVDFVSYFLLKGKEGYCTYFASAMTVLCRMVGLPARYVEGYVARPTSNGTAYVTGLDAHAWTEVYFGGFGWLTFDATPPRQQDGPNGPEMPPEDQSTPEPSETPPDEQDDPGETPEDNPEEQDNPEDNPEDNPSPEPETLPDEQDPSLTPKDETDEDDEKPWYLLWLLAVLAIAACAYRVYLVMPLSKAKRQKNLEGAYAVWMQAIYDTLYLKKLKMLPGETLITHAKRLDDTRTLTEKIMPVALVQSHLSYSTHAVEAEYVSLAKETFEGIEKQMKWYEKVRFMAYRAVTPQKKANYLARIRR